MIYLKFFENHSIDNIKKEILYPKIINIINDIIHISLDFLDEGIRDEENTLLPKTIVIGVDIEKDGYIESLLGTQFENMETYNEDNDIYWESNDIEKLRKINEDIKLNKIKLNVNFSIVINVDGITKPVDYQSDIYERMKIAYPDVKFDTFAPWDLN